MEALKIGDVVQYHDGGPRMTVNAIGDVFIDCTWFDGAHMMAGRFHVGTLTHVAAEES